jgi:hypothetical protein
VTIHCAVGYLAFGAMSMFGAISWIHIAKAFYGAGIFKCTVTSIFAGVDHWLLESIPADLF